MPRQPKTLTAKKPKSEKPNATGYPLVACSYTDFEIILDAAAQGDLKTLRSVSALADLCLCGDSDDGWTPLMLAIRNNQQEAIGFLLPLSDARQVNHRGENALHLAAQEGDARLVGLLLPLSEPGVLTESGRTPLFEAVKGSGPGHVECVKLLASFEAAAVDAHASKVLKSAVAADLVDNVRALIEHAREAIEKGTKASAEMTALAEATLCGSWACADWFTQWATPEQARAVMDEAGRENTPRTAAYLESQELRAALSPAISGAQKETNVGDEPRLASRRPPKSL